MDALNPRGCTEPETWVLDTNIWLDWLLFEDPAVEPIGAAARAGRLALVTDDECAAEFTRVLSYDFGTHTPDESRRSALGEAFSSLTRRVALGAASLDRLPACRDPDDQKFLALALRAKASVLVTRDKALLELARPSREPLPFRILAPTAACARVPAPRSARQECQETVVPAGSRGPLASCQVRS